MKFFLKIFSVILVVCMMLLSVIGYIPHSNLLFAESSADYFMELIVAPIYLATIILICFVIVLYYCFKKPRRNKLIFLIIIFFVWFLSGRTISTEIYPNGKISQGWFYIKTNSFSLCNYTEDCETVVYQETSMRKLLLWRVQIKNKNIDNTIFIGPFIWKKTLKTFSEKFSNTPVMRSL